MIFYSIAISLFLCSALICWLSAPFWARWARRFNLIDQPGERKIHQQATPYGGGLAILFGILLTIIVAYLMLIYAPEFLPMAWRNFIFPHLAGLAEFSTRQKLGGLLAGALLIFIMGLFDDRYNLSARIKLLVQISAALLAYFSGVKIGVFAAWWLNLPLTILWIVLITNAFNLLDNMDGLSAGVAAIAGIFLLTIMSEQYYFTAALISVFVGAVVGFLPRNFAAGEHKIFMGDAGALLIGYLLAGLTIAGNYYVDRGLSHTLLMPVILLSVPLFDTFSVIIIRLRAGKSMMVGDNNHLSHRLVKRGFSQLQAVQIIFLLSAIFGLLAQLLGQLNTAGALIVFGSVLCIIMLMTVLMREK